MHTAVGRGTEGPDQVQEADGGERSGGKGCRGRQQGGRDTGKVARGGKSTRNADICTAGRRSARLVTEHKLGGAQQAQHLLPMRRPLLGHRWQFH